MKEDERMVARKSMTFGVLALGLMMGGCKSDQDKANDAALAQAKQQAAASGNAQQVAWVDKDGNTVTSVVQPPAPGQTTQQIMTTKTTHSTTTTSAARPVVQGPATGPVGPGQTAVGPGYSSSPASQDGRYPADNRPAYPANNGGGYAAGPGQAVSNGAPTVTPVDVRVRRGTTLAIRINQHISVKTSRAGDRFTGEVVRDIAADGSDRVAIPHGTPVSGVIDASHRRGHFKGRSILELRLTSMEMNGQHYRLDTGDSVRTKKGKGKRSAAFIGGGAGLGMLVGGVASGGVGLLVGGLAGRARVRRLVV